MKFKREDGKFDVERFKAAVRIFITAQEILVDNASYPTKEIAENSHIFRTLGLGYANLGSLIMSYGYGYDSEEGRAFAARSPSIMTGEAYEQSARMAAGDGPVPGLSRCALQRRAEAGREGQCRIDAGSDQTASLRGGEIQPSEEFDYLKDEARQSLGQRAVDRQTSRLSQRAGHRARADRHDRFLMDCDTTGIEPDIALVKYKLLAGGGMLKIVNRTVPPALRTARLQLGGNRSASSRTSRSTTRSKTSRTPTARRFAAGLKPEHLPIFDCAFKPHRGQRSLGYMAHLRMMAAAQPFLSGAISKTVNMPRELHGRRDHEHLRRRLADGLEGDRDLSRRLEAFRAVEHEKDQRMGGDRRRRARHDGRATGTRSAHSGTGSANSASRRGKPVRHRMPDTRMSLTHKFDIAGHEGYITVGLFEDGQPGELFITMAKEGTTIGGLMDTVGTLTRMALQYGVPLEALVKKFAHQRFEPSGFTKNPDIRNATTITDYVFRWLGCQFIKGYKEATSPHRTQPELPMKEIPDMEKKAVNRPVSDLPRTGEKEMLDVITNHTPNEGAPANVRQQRITPTPNACDALGAMFMDITCSHCGSEKVIRAGACGVCTECGTSQGCS